MLLQFRVMLEDRNLIVKTWSTERLRVLQKRSWDTVSSKSEATSRILSSLHESRIITDTLMAEMETLQVVTLAI